MAGEAHSTVVSDYVTLIRGTTYKGDLVGKPGPALLGLGSIEPGGGFRSTGYKTYGGECPEELMLVPGDIYASLKGATKDGKMIGSVARVPASVSTGRLTQDTVKLVFRNASRAQASYLYWVLRTPQYRDYCAGRATGSAVVALSRNDFLSYPVPPSTRWREVIVALLDEIEKRIELNRRMSETLESMARALFKSWFVDFDPVRAKLDGRWQRGQSLPGLPGHLYDLFPDHLVDSELGEIPEGWRVGALQDVLAELEVGGRPKGGVAAYTEGVPSIGAESIVGLGIFDYSKTKYVPQEYFDQMTKGHIQSWDVLLYKDGGRPGEFEPHITLFGDGFPFRTAAINEHVYRLRANPDVGQEFLYFWLSSNAVMEEMRVRGTGVAVPGLNSTQVKSLTTLRPPEAVLESFTGQTKLAIASVLAACNESRTLATLRDTLLPKLISGELRVKDVERRIADEVAA